MKLEFVSEALVSSQSFEVIHLQVMGIDEKVHERSREMLLEGADCPKRVTRFRHRVHFAPICSMINTSGTCESGSLEAAASVACPVRRDPDLRTRIGTTRQTTPAVVFLAVACCGLVSCVSESTPVPANHPTTHNVFPPRDAFVLPNDITLREQLEEALDLRSRDDFDRALDAKDPGELLEHATFTQLAIDNGIFRLDALFVVGDELFDYEFRPEQGLGNRLGKQRGIRAGHDDAPNLRRVHEGEFGGPDSHACSTCHLKGGPDGAGNNTQNAFLRGDGNSTLSADERNPPHLLGLGPVAALAQEMTAELKAQRNQALEAARQRDERVRVDLKAKGVAFGQLVASPDGAVDTSGVAGVDSDLIIKPFGWKGHKESLRGMVEESFRIHLGIVSMYDQHAFRDSQRDKAIYGDGRWADVDRDGTTLEVDEGMLTTMVAYLTQLEVPVVRPPQTEALLAHFARGRHLFDQTGCADCHRPILELQNPVLELRARGEDLKDRKPILVNVAHDGEHPKIEPHNVLETAFNVELFSDLRRHDMGPGLASPTPQAETPASVFLTRPLWGLAFTAPYLHDGRAPSVDDAIRLHGGEAAASRDAYLNLSGEERASMLVFLLSLTRQPKLFAP